MKYTYNRGYKGRQSALNGLSLYIQNNIKLEGKVLERLDKTYDIIIEYANTIEGFTPKGNRGNVLHHASIKIQEDFDSFVKHIKYLKINK
jgi:hypothetical protein